MSKLPLIRTYYDGLQPSISDTTATVIDLALDPSMTKQEFSDECDINNIMARFEKTGEIIHTASLSPRYGDFSIVPDYQTALNLVADAQLTFDSLPAKIRDRFLNDPSKFLEFVSDASNEAEMRSLGILETPPGSDASPGPQVEAEGAPAPPSASTPS